MTSSDTSSASPAAAVAHTHAHDHGDACGCGHDHHGHHHHAPVATYHRSGPKVGRNDPCPCGSGKKHKKCCLGAA
ncbi:MAG: SEC-C metal-binding domain-containing protein [Hyphomicrobiaceae bacterium]